MKDIKAKFVESTIKAFFASVYRYASENSKLYTKVSDLQAIDTQGEVVKAQEKQIMEMVATRKKGFDAYTLNKMAYNITTMEFPGAYQMFMKPKNIDNSALVAYRDVIRGITDYLYYNQEPEVFLRPLKKWNYVISDNQMKDLIYPFLPLKHFVVKDEQR